MMKIGVVSVWNDSLELFRFLHRYDHKYVIWYDADTRPLGDKTRHRQIEIIQQWYDGLVAAWCQAIIVPPVGEIAGIGFDGRVLPLYQQYVMGAWKQSLVGKVGYLAESGQMVQSINMVQQWLETRASEYQRTQAQLQTKQFHRPMDRWGRDVRQWKYFLRSLSPRNYLINKVVKFDLRKFKDIDVDTVLPTEWSHFAMEKTIERFFNRKRTKRHGMSFLEIYFQQLLVAGDEWLDITPETSDYGVTVLSRGDIVMLESVQKYPWLMTRGKQIPIVFRSLDRE